MPIAQIAGIAVAVALLVGSYFLGREHGIESKAGELQSLREAIAEANADAILKAQEAARDAKEQTERAQDVVDKAKQLVADAEALRAADADDYRERLRTALARTCRSGPVYRPRVPETAGNQPARGETIGVLPGTVLERTDAAIEEVERLNDNYGFCLRAYRTMERDR